MPKSRQSRRSRRGGADLSWLNPFGSQQGNPQGAPSMSPSPMSQAPMSPSPMSPSPMSPSTPAPPSSGWFRNPFSSGGKRRRRTRRCKSRSRRR